MCWCLFSLANSLIFINKSFLRIFLLAAEEKKFKFHVQHVFLWKWNSVSGLPIFNAAGEKLIGCSRFWSILEHKSLWCWAECRGSETFVYLVRVQALPAIANRWSWLFIFSHISALLTSLCSMNFIYANLNEFDASASWKLEVPVLRSFTVAFDLNRLTTNSCLTGH